MVDGDRHLPIWLQLGSELMVTGTAGPGDGYEDPIHDPWFLIYDSPLPKGDIAARYTWSCEHHLIE